MNIVFINYEYPPIGGGAANATLYLAKHIAKLGHQPIVVTSSYRDLPLEEISDGIRVIRCRSLRRKANQSNIFEMATYVVSAGVFLLKFLRRERIDASIVFFSIPGGPLGLFLNFHAAVPYIVSLRGGDVPGSETSLALIYKILQPLRRLVFRKSRAIVANSESLKKMSEKVDPFPVHIIPNGVDTDYYRPGENQFEGSKDNFKFIFVGRFQRQKNITFILDQIAALKCFEKKHFEVHFVGDGPLREKLQNKTKNLGLEEMVFWHGWLGKEALRSFYQSANCLINASLYEGMPNASLEAMACGLPIIASDVAGNNDIVRHGETGFLFPLGQPDALSRLMHRVINSPQEASSLGAQGRRLAMHQFSWSNVAQQYLRLLTHDAA